MAAILGILKKIKRTKSSSLSELEGALVREVSAIEVTILRSILRLFSNRLDFVINNSDALFENIVK